jgi:maltose/moltooligosaccharide transporter
MSFGFLGIQFGFALQNANMSRIFETLGADPSNIAFYWLAAPVTGFFVQPIIGYFSDRTWSKRWGRRRPYFAVGAILATFALFMIPNTPAIGRAISADVMAALYIAIGMLWIIDGSINISMEPFRAFVGDKLPSSQRTVGFATQSFFIGTGAVVASILPYLFTNVFGVANSPPPGEIPPSVRWSFYLGGIAFLGAVMYTVFTTDEYPPEDLEAFEREKAESRGVSPIFTEIFEGLLSMPKTMKQLAFVQFFSWFALFAMWIYTTSGVTSTIYGTTDTASEIYNTGANWVGVCFAVYNGVAAAVAFLLPALAKVTSRKATHMICLIAGAIGLASVFFIKNPDLLLLSMVGVGIAWASILSMPYAMLAGALPPKKMGFYMGVFNFFIVLPQIVAGLILGFLLKTFFNEEPIYALLLGGASMVIAAALTILVQDKDDHEAEEEMIDEAGSDADLTNYYNR